MPAASKAGPTQLKDVISVRDLLNAGVHFGHRTDRWNPKMKPYIFGARNGVHIIDLQQTAVLLRRSFEFARKVTAEGRTILFVGTKRAASQAIQEEAQRCGMPFVSHRWLGGMLTNARDGGASCGVVGRE